MRNELTPMNGLFCSHYQMGVCRSCVTLPISYEQQLINKQSSVEQALAQFDSIHWLPIVASQPQAFRNKAKMVVSDHWQAPILGIIDRQFQPADLVDCPLYPEGLASAFEPIRNWIREYQLMPYDVQRRTGELKHLIISIDEHSAQLMLRIVLRSHTYVEKITQAIQSLQHSLPRLAVISINIQPLAAAIVEGEEEIVLTETSVLTMWLNDLPLYCQPRSFFQTNTPVAAALYRQAQTWIKKLQPNTLWDLFCGVGGFALHAAQVMKGQVTGIEINAQAIASAKRTANLLGLTQLEFRSLSASDFALAQANAPDCIVINPPRRGIGTELCQFLNQSKTQWLIYSSCNPQSLAEDMAQMHHYQPIEAQVFDMFPHTHHAEVLVLMRRK